MTGARIRSIHRWASIAMLGFWLVQALTGLLLVFQWEIDDATVAAPRVPTDIAAIDSRLTGLVAADPDLAVRSLNTSGSGLDRYDINLDDGGERVTLRIDGSGRVLRHHGPGDGIRNGGLFTAAYDLHESLLAGDAGMWIVGISGLLLLSNILLGLCLAWPGRTWARWRMALRPPARLRGPARPYGWHRAAGLAMAIPALLTIGCGTALIFLAGIEAMAGIERYEPSAPALGKGQAPIAMPAAVARARRLYPQAVLTRIDYPAAGMPYYGVQFRQRGEAALIFGSTIVYVAAADGRVIGRVDPFAMPLRERALDLLYPIHTGEIGGLPGRIAIFLIGLWLAAMILLGVWLWQSRRHRRTAPARRKRGAMPPMDGSEIG
ncbi:PepSY domain-containing protein [Sphingopyxis sp.]|uniref:PepSY-associated TM helix domain-containing protein n=1 Tax=Sphingopyxis sp. TaxID=1908224 RepID=UPI002620C04F|nr:PepSY-associated TM helix domain-containing protein [Sphingopyxis sp.]MCW0197753.1 PepSY domain-containing protein [Sphingopyxis sp.]